MSTTFLVTEGGDHRSKDALELLDTEARSAMIARFANMFAPAVNQQLSRGPRHGTIDTPKSHILEVPSDIVSS